MIKFQITMTRTSGVPPEADQVSGVRCRVSGVRCQVSGVGCQVSGKRNIEAETCWSEAEIPSEAKRQRGTLKPETSVIVIWNLELLFLQDSSKHSLTKRAVCLQNDNPT